MTTINMDRTAGNQRKSWAPLLELSAQEVFSLMLGCELQSSPSRPPGDGLDVTAIVGLAGSMRGLLTLRCSSKSAVVMAANMLGIDDVTASQEALDAVGEVCNMVAGNFKNKIAGLGDGCRLSVPTVIAGEAYAPHPSEGNGKIEVNMLLEGFPLLISLEVNS
jgi:chemotaxis protein CheX